jgi:hypothetical protein
MERKLLAKSSPRSGTSYQPFWRASYSAVPPDTSTRMKELQAGLKALLRAEAYVGSGGLVGNLLRMGLRGLTRVAAPVTLASA